MYFDYYECPSKTRMTIVHLSKFLVLTEQTNTIPSIDTIPSELRVQYENNHDDLEPTTSMQLLAF